MDQSNQDSRFSRVFTDPKFRTLRNVDKKHKIDKRFKSMFTDDKFKLKYSMDKRGKSKKHLMSEDYKKFYHLSDEEEDEKETNELASASKNEEEFKADSVEKQNEQVDLEPNVLSKKIGSHRGVNLDDDESSSSSSESESEEEEEELEHHWNELDKDVAQIEESTSRLAICNADWDRINAQDLYILLNSFKKATGTLHQVTIYFSNFGMKRLVWEQAKGPSDFIFGKAEVVNDVDSDHADDDEEDNSDVSDEEKIDSKSVEKLRKYQMERLKYFYAIATFDSAQTAETVYAELDGMEYESSATTLDVRYVPNEMSFEDDKVKEECDSMPGSNYKPSNFVNTALQQSKVKFTWDETDYKRQQTFEKAFEKDYQDDLQAYLASSSDDDDEQQDELYKIDEDAQDVDKINKYKELLKSLDRKDDDVEMEVTWKPKATAETTNQNDTDAQDIDLDMNDIEKYRSEEDEESDEDVEITKKKEVKKSKKNKFASEEKSPDPAADPNIELLMMDIEHKDKNKKHFNYKEIVDTYAKGNEVNDDDQFKVLLMYFLKPFSYLFFY